MASVEFAESILLIAGCVVLAGLLGDVARRGAWRGLFRFEDGRWGVETLAVADFRRGESVPAGDGDAAVAANSYAGLSIVEPPRPFRLGDVLLPLIWFLFTPLIVTGLLTRPDGSGAGDVSTIPPRVRIASQLVTQAMTLLVTLFVARRAMRGDWAAWGLRRGGVGRDAAWAVAGYLACWPAVWGVAMLTRTVVQRIAPHVSLPEHTAVEYLRSPETTRIEVGLVVLGAALLAPVMEELLFRGVLQNAAANAARSTWAGIVVSALMFGLIHAELHHVPALMVFGAVLGYAYVRSGSLWLPVLMHVVFNVKTLVFLWWSPAG
ncbi:MAG: CPBP family intramembrane metalloprotease [Phycisphaerae bacterium]|nr:CPBP family intramembrane metalloprotease [Phycisphaerae bacterium]NUQ46608.1 CPBP family intramembrane metalloprotease [Phycisphaerae bacterium]